MARKKKTTADANGLALFDALPPPTRAQQKLMDAAVEIELDTPDRQDVAFLGRHLVQCTFPHKDPGDIPQWTRRSDNVILGLQPGYDLETGRSIGIPFGSGPRLLVVWINTEVVKTKSRRIFLGSSLSAFLDVLGYDPVSRGKRSDAKRFLEQMRRTFRCSISFQETIPATTEHGEGQRWMNMPVVEGGEVWWHTKEPRQGGLWESYIDVGPTFYQSILASHVPLDMRALKALKRSPLALDLYNWSTYTVDSANRKGPRFAPWRQLAKQMGADYGRLDNFVQKAIHTLQTIQLVYPGFRFELVRGGLLVLPGRTAIAPVR